MLTHAQRTHLECGYYFFDWQAGDRFRDADHGRRAWAFHGEQIMSDWTADAMGNAWRCPLAYWQYDQGLRTLGDVVSEGRRLVWPRGNPRRAPHDSRAGARR